MKIDKDYGQLAKGILKAEMARQSIKVSQLGEKLRAAGFDAPEDAGLRMRINAGRFTADFLFQCLYVVGVDEVTLGSSRISLKDYWATKS